MKSIKITAKTADVELSLQEIKTFVNAINEVCEAIPKAEFKTRMGGSCEEYMALSNSLLKGLERLKSDSTQSET
jgi:hypothetical protein